MGRFLCDVHSNGVARQRVSRDVDAMERDAMERDAQAVVIAVFKLIIFFIGVTGKIPDVSVPRRVEIQRVTDNSARCSEILVEKREVYYSACI